LFLYLVGHLMLQTPPAGRRLIWFYDLYLLFRGPLRSLDWDVYLKSESLSSWAAWTQAALYRLRDLFGIAMPPSLRERSLPRPASPATKVVIRQYIHHAWTQLGRLERLQMGLALFFPNRTYLQWRYRIRHRWLWPLYLPRRWWEMGRYWAQER